MSGTIHGEEVLTLPEAAEYCGYAVTTFMTTFKEWGLEPTRMGGRNYWFKDQLDKFKAGRIPERYGTGVRWRHPRQGEAA